MATVRPLGDRVLVRVIPRVRTTAGGIVLPDNVREESDRGEVLAVGPGSPVNGAPPMMRLAARAVKEISRAERDEALPESVGEPEAQVMLVPIPIKVGEVIVFSPYAGSKVAVGSDDYLLLREHDVLGVLDFEWPEGDDLDTLALRHGVTFDGESDDEKVEALTAKNAYPF